MLLLILFIGKVFAYQKENIEMVSVQIKRIFGKYWSECHDFCVRFFRDIHSWKK
jgi:hypothetical protein